ncbi:aspartyl protease [Rhodobacter veldkampii DSM 11550]|uniref:TIGR02281 family clan AA aspartic protease n=1 Tax=Phaeovulum veldkampii DSM 11550 TaxID=1185920 RepID=A0A2T4JKJ8_9RHOB|nr:TIGR02281 family clan AA aspartic protease [Phaeovulum veldkampii]MBK5945417.1 aspartyl protease [Phaeovulum veldkampii DSM 11550]NCU20921.1 TIGR02281 family clan AA aspartic protease [Candidatus Falkowbacteria bacterium]PTE18287.1 TIGR02281 family clan AA aspartic protease [Phaeovulum veldkampii DSM 11550]TDQ57763.1 aspartyl protease family protein [Phaeovulum veldkampii DSM 11550]
MDQDMFARLAYLALLLVAVGGWLIIDLRRNPGRSLQQAAIWVLIFLGVVAAVGLWGDIRRDIAPRQAVMEGGRVELPVAADGHFYLLAEVNGVTVRFVVDTGASDIVLTRRDAARVGLDPDGLSYFGQANTANGRVVTAPVRIAEFALGGIVDRDLRAVVNGGEMDGSLLGMAYLNRFSRLELSRDRMVLER